MKIGILETAVQCAYEIAGESACLRGDRRGRETIMRHVRSMKVLQRQEKRMKKESEIRESYRKKKWQKKVRRKKNV